MSKRKARGGEFTDVERRDNVRSKLCATTTSSKTALAKTLHVLQKEGLLNDNLLSSSINNERRCLGAAVAAHAKSSTPYGLVVQSMDIGDGVMWDFINPFALIYHLTSISTAFSEFFHEAVHRARGELQVLIYGDEFVPGNPNRVDKGRSLMSYYYSFLSFPTYMLNMCQGWFVFGELRNKLLKETDECSGHGAMVALMLKTFFVDGVSNFTKGFRYIYRGALVTARGVFRGIIGDEKGLKEMYDIKGQAGWKSCISCKNVFNFIHKDGHTSTEWDVGLNCADRSRFKPLSNRKVQRLVDRLIEGTDRHDVEMQSGINYNPLGVLFCPELRNIVRIGDHYIRDWQHTLASHGCMSAQVGGVMAALKKLNIPWVESEAFSQKCHEPKSAKTFNSELFSSKYVEKEYVKAFAGEMLSMVPRLFLFLWTHRLLPKFSKLGEHIKCLGQLLKIQSILQHYKDCDARVAAMFQSAVDTWALLYVRLYAFVVKIKFHHMFAHLHDDLVRLGKVIGCFAMERKHKDVKRHVVHVFRNLEYSCTINYLNAWCESIATGDFRYGPRGLINPRSIADSRRRFSPKAELAIGHIEFSDIVQFTEEDGVRCVAEVQRFFSTDDSDDVHVLVKAYKRLSTDDTYGSIVSEWDTAAPEELLVHGSMVDGALIWVKRQRNVIIVIELPR